MIGMNLRTSIVFVLLVTACGGGGGEDPGSGIDPRVARVDAFDAQRMRVLGDVGTGAIGMASTPDASLPISGSVNFEGFTTIRVENPNQPLVLYGDTAVTIGFGGGAVTGTMDAFFGTNDLGDVVDYGGEILIDAGSTTAGLTLDYGGALTEGVNTLVFDGTLEGLFLGDPLGAISASDLEAGVFYNGAPLDATVVLVAETVPPI